MIAQEFEGVPVELVRARFGDGVHRRARVHAVGRGRAARRDAELLQRIGKRKRHAARVLDVVVKRAVQHVHDTEIEPARDGDVHPTLEAAAVRASRLNRRARERDEVGDLAPLKRQLDDPLLLHDLANAGASHVDDGRGRFDGYRFLEVADARAVLIVGLAATCRTRPVCAKVLNPCSDTSSR
jgi:hypothetical protein